MASVEVLQVSTSTGDVQIPSTPSPEDPASLLVAEQSSLTIVETTVTVEELPSGVPRTIYDETDTALLLGPTGSETIMVNRQGLKLKRYFWAAPSNTAKCTLLFVHGHGAHQCFELLNYQGPGLPPTYQGSWVQSLNNGGINVVGIDNQGCGRSEGFNGLRFYVDSFDDYVTDVLQVAESVSTDLASSKPLPLFIAGVSLGGCITFFAVQRRPELFAGALLLAPMLSLERASRKGLNPIMRPLASIFSRIIPTAPIIATDRNSLYPNIQAMWDADPLTMHIKTRVRNAHEYLRATEMAMASLEDIDLPLLLVHSENDTMTDAEGSKQLYLKAKSGDKTLRLVNSFWHVLLKEPSNEKILAMMTEWILARVDK